MSTSAPARNEVETLPDGSVVVRDLPIMSEERETDARYKRERPVRARMFGTERPRDRKWLERCRARLLARAERGYKLLTTFRHSDEQPEAAGRFRPTEIRLHEVNPGEAPRWTLFADAFFPTRAAYEKWKSEYPYRSPEISPDYPEELDSLAFLSAEAPFNKYETPALVEKNFRARRPHLAQAWRGRALAPLERAPGSKQQAVVGNALASRGLGAPTKTEGRMADEVKPDPAKDKQAATGSSGGSPDPIKALHEQFSAYMAASDARHKELMECLRSTLEAKKGDAEPEVEETDVEAKADEPSAEPAVFHALKVLRTENEKFRAESEKQRAKTEGELLGLRKVIADSQAKEQRNELVAGAETRLASMGFTLDDEDKKAIRESAKRGKDAVDDLLAGYKRAHAHAAPTGSLESYGTAHAGEEPLGDEPEALKKLLKEGGQVALAGKAMFRAWKDLSPRAQREGWGGDFESFLYDYDATGNRVLASNPSKNGRG